MYVYYSILTFLLTNDFTDRLRGLDSLNTGYPRCFPQCTSPEGYHLAERDETTVRVICFDSIYFKCLCLVCQNDRWYGFAYGFRKFRKPGQGTCIKYQERINVLRRRIMNIIPLFLWPTRRFLLLIRLQSSIQREISAIPLIKESNEEAYRL